MLTTLAAWRRASLRPWLALGRNACAALEPAGLLTALADLALLDLATGEARPQDLAAAVARDAGRPLRSEVILDHPFAAVRALRPADAPARRRILLAAPYSGYATTVLSGLVAALVQEAEVLVTDWRDARAVPLAAGRFELADQIAPQAAHRAVGSLAMTRPRGRVERGAALVVARSRVHGMPKACQGSE